MTAPVPGWYADPAGDASLYRWWDGAGWTAWLTNDPHAEPPVSTAPPAPDLGPGQAPPQATERPGRSLPPGYERRSRAATEAEPGAGRPPVRAARALGIGAVVVAVVVVVSIAVFGNQAGPDELGEGFGPLPAPSSAGGSSSPSAKPETVGYDPATRRVTIKTFSTVLPGPPYKPASAVGDFPVVLGRGVSADAVVQDKYDGKNSWFATVAVGELNETVTKSGKATTIAQAAYASFVAQAYPSSAHAKPGKLTTKTVQQVGTDQAAIVQGHTNYRQAGVTSRYDQVSVLICHLDSGPWIGWVSFRPEKSSKQVQDQLQTAIGTIRVTA